MKVIEISERSYEILEKIADNWEKRSTKAQEKNPDIKIITSWDPSSVLYILTMMEYRRIEEENENNINQNE